MRYENLPMGLSSQKGQHLNWGLAGAKLLMQSYSSLSPPNLAEVTPHVIVFLVTTQL